ncbi:MAG TPA: hypothetical protein VLH94_02075 [Spirochaetia bacterium]|nr:hypothetical protein [Spirochaetia bacterium]
MLIFDSKPMTTKLSNPAISRVNSLTVQESYLKVNKNSSHDLTAHTIKENHKQGYVEARGILPDLANYNCPLLLPKDTLPHIEQEEVNRLAKVWCELILGKVLEDRRNKTIRSAISA